MNNFNVRDWYWFVGGDESRVYSSRRNTYVDPGDADYQAWVESNGAAGNVPDEPEVWYYTNSVFPTWMFNGTTFSQPTPDTFTKDQLKSYASEVNVTTATGGITVNGMPFATDVITVGSLNSAVIYTADKATSDTYSWKLPDGSWVTVDKEGIKALQNAVSLFGQDCFECEADIGDGIDAGTVTDLAAIDAAFAAVNKVFTGATSMEARVPKGKSGKRKG